VRRGDSGIGVLPCESSILLAVLLAGRTPIYIHALVKFQGDAYSARSRGKCILYMNQVNVGKVIVGENGMLTGNLFLGMKYP